MRSGQGGRGWCFAQKLLSGKHLLTPHADRDCATARSNLVFFQLAVAWMLQKPIALFRIVQAHFLMESKVKQTIIAISFATLATACGEESKKKTESEAPSPQAAPLKPAPKTKPVISSPEVKTSAIDEWKIRDDEFQKSCLENFKSFLSLSDVQIQNHCNCAVKKAQSKPRPSNPSVVELKKIYTDEDFAACLQDTTAQGTTAPQIVENAVTDATVIPTDEAFPTPLAPSIPSDIPRLKSYTQNADGSYLAVCAYDQGERVHTVTHAQLVAKRVCVNDRMRLDGVYELPMNCEKEISWRDSSRKWQERTSIEMMPARLRFRALRNGGISFDLTPPTAKVFPLPGFVVAVFDRTNLAKFSFVFPNASQTFEDKVVSSVRVSDSSLTVIYYQGHKTGPAYNNTHYQCGFHGKRITSYRGDDSTLYFESTPFLDAPF